MMKQFLITAAAIGMAREMGDHMLKRRPVDAKGATEFASKLMLAGIEPFLQCRFVHFKNSRFPNQNLYNSQINIKYITYAPVAQLDRVKTSNQLVGSSTKM